MLREAGAIEALVAMLSPERAAEEHVAALGAVCNLVEREESAADMLRLQGGLKRLRPLLATSDTLRPAHAARVLEHVASANQPTKVAMRVLDLLVPLVGLLSSHHGLAIPSIITMQIEMIIRLKCQLTITKRRR